MIKLWTCVLMAVLYIAAGLNHFRVPEFYLPIIPPYLPWPRLLNFTSGACEIALGLGLLWPPTRPYAAWGIIALLVAVFPANLYMFQARSSEFQSLPSWLLFLRLPMQGLLIFWAYLYT